MLEKIDTPHGRDMYSRRRGIIEPVFANIKVHKGLNRFTLRTKRKVNEQWLPFCMVHNIGKIAKCFLLFVFAIRSRVENYITARNVQYQFG